MKLPSAKSGVAVAFGAERRTEKINLATDSLVATGALSGTGGATPPIEGKYTVTDIFGEVRVPLVEGAPMAELISASGSIRHSNYSTNISTDTYGIGLDWAPNKMARVRGSYQSAIRAANLVELFQAQGTNLEGYGDPCEGASPTATRDQCARSGVTATQYGNIPVSSAGQWQYLQGGNPNLQPEKAKTYTLGLVLTPTKNLNATIDWFDIKIDNTISFVDASITLNQCLTNGSYCNLIQRDSLGSLWFLPQGYVTATNQNIGSTRTSGVDLSLSYLYALPSGFGKLGFNYIGTYLDKLETEPVPGLGKYDCVGLYGGSKCNAPNPQWRHKLRGTWMTPWNVDFAATIRYIDSVKIQESTSQPMLTGEFFTYQQNLPSRTYLDLAASWMATKQLTIRGGINNILDKDPPLSDSTTAGPSTFGNGNTWPGTYDSLGRKIFVNLVYKF
jgi:outer membrane receptor protein involved in Fe transport